MTAHRRGQAATAEDGAVFIHVPGECSPAPNTHRRAFNDPRDPSTPTTIRPLCCGPSEEASGCGDDRPALAIGSLWVRGRPKGHSALGDCYERERDRRREYRRS